MNYFGRPPKRVECLDKDTEEVVAVYESLSAAAKAVAKSTAAKASISNVCQGYQITAYGYKWRYADQ